MVDPRRATLGLPENASLEEVKAEFRRLALVWHPDVRQDGSAASRQRWHDLLAAYRSLTEPGLQEARRVPAGRPGWAPSTLARAARVQRTLLVCGATLVGGCFVFGGALSLHWKYDLYGANRFRGSLEGKGRRLEEAGPHLRATRPGPPRPD